MKIIHVMESREQCAEAGWYAYDCMTDAPVDDACIEALATMGELIYLRHLKHPFFKIENEHLMIKGLTGTMQFRVAATKETEQQVIKEVTQTVIMRGK